MAKVLARCSDSFRGEAKMCPRDSRGLTLIEVIVALAVVLVVLLGLLVALPNAREQGRRMGCLRNLQQIGAAVALYDTATGQLPTVAPDFSGASPLSALLGQLGLVEFEGLGPGTRLDAPATAPLGPRLLPDVICPADAQAPTRGFQAPASYRACAGGMTSGGNGAFAPGRTTRLAEVRDADGAEFTAGFAERLVGTAQETPARENYAVVPGPVSDGPESSLTPRVWRGDAGSDWSKPGWTSTLYNHALPPGAEASRIAEDGRTARMGASSAHPGVVHVLWLDGRAQPVRTTIDPAVWRGFATMGISTDLAEAAAAP